MQRMDSNTPAMPGAPEAPRKSNALKITGLIVGGFVAVGAIGAIAMPKAETPAPVVVTETAAPDVSHEIPEGSAGYDESADTAPPVVQADPMDEAIAQLKSEIFVEKWVHMVHQTEYDWGHATTRSMMIRAIEKNEAGDGSLGGSWLEVSATYHIGLTALHEEMYDRYA